MPRDKMKQRLTIAVILSMLINAAVWIFVAQLVRSPTIVPLPPATFKRILIPSLPKPPKKLHQFVPPKPKPVVPPVPQEQPKVTKAPPPRPQPQQPQRSRVLASNGPAKSERLAQSGASAPVGKPITQQPAAPQPIATPTPPPPVQPLPVQSRPQPWPRVPSPPVGPTEEAQSSNEIYPDIPDELKTDDYKSYVHVKVDIAANGTYAVQLVTSSGNEDIDQRVLAARSNSGDGSRRSMRESQSRVRSDFGSISRCSKPEFGYS